MRLKTVSSQMMVARQDLMMKLGLVGGGTLLAGMQGLRQVLAGRTQGGVA